VPRFSRNRCKRIHAPQWLGFHVFTVRESGTSSLRFVSEKSSALASGKLNGTRSAAREVEPLIYPLTQLQSPNKKSAGSRAGAKLRVDTLPGTFVRDAIQVPQHPCLILIRELEKSAYFAD
jgi:hypothetical protein